MGDTWYLDEVFVQIQGRQQYLWRAVDEDVIDIVVQSRRIWRSRWRVGWRATLARLLAYWSATWTTEVMTVRRTTGVARFIRRGAGEAC